MTEEDSIERAIKARIQAWKENEEAMLREQEEKAEQRVEAYMVERQRKEKEMEKKWRSRRVG